MANPHGALLSGMYGLAIVPLERADDVVVVPREAIVSRAGKRLALRIDAESVVGEVAIDEGLSNPTQIQITSGLKAGDVIVADARRDVAAGTKVNAIFGK